MPERRFRPGSPASPGRRGRRLLGWVAGGGGVCLVAALFLAALHAKERDNRFCIACHLHEEKFARLNTAAPRDLAGFHRQQKAEVGCIACHGGTDPMMRAKVWAVAAVDTLKFLAGAYGEPSRMRLRLRDAECRQCHAPILKPRAAAAPTSAQPPPPAAPFDPGDEATFGAGTEGGAATSYHALRDHDGVRVPCVRCHTSHTTDSDQDNRFVSRPTVRPICVECHKHMANLLDSPGAVPAIPPAPRAR